MTTSPLRHAASLPNIAFEEAISSREVEARRSLEEGEGTGYRHKCSLIQLALVTHRELAYQIAEQFRVLGKPLGLKDCIIVGGMGTVAERLGWAMGSLLIPPTQSHLSLYFRHGDAGPGALSEATRGYCHPWAPG